MKKIILIGFLSLFVIIGAWGQSFPELQTRKYVSDTALFAPRKPWVSIGEVVGINVGVWAFDRFVMNEDFARINLKTIKSNFRKGPVWDTDKFSTNLFAHPYHGSFYFNSARNNGMNFWQSTPFVAGGSLMWEFFMEKEPPSINDLLATTFGGIELGEITYRLSDLFIDSRTTGVERVARELLSGVISPVRGLNRLFSGEAWRKSNSKGRRYTAVPVNFVVTSGLRFLAEEGRSKHGAFSMNLSFAINYGNPFDDEFYAPYEWFQFHLGMDMFSSQPFINRVNAVGALWGKQVWKSGGRKLMAGVFQHFDYYDSSLKSTDGQMLSPYRISEAAAIGGGLIYNNNKEAKEKINIYGEFYLTGIALGAGMSDYFKLDNRDYNLGSGYSTKVFAGISYNKRWSFLLNMENYHIYTWKGYEPDVDLDKVDISTFNVQGNNGHSQLTVFSAKVVYTSGKKWHIMLSNDYFARSTYYKYYDDVDKYTTGGMLTFGITI